MYLHSWDRFSKVYSFDPDTGIYQQRGKEVDEAVIAKGFVKVFMFGKKIAFYQINDEWWVQYKKIRININDDRLYFEAKYVGLLTILIAHFDKIRVTLIDSNFGLLVSRKIDPTHDSWDEENINFISRLSVMKKGLVKVTDSGSKL